MSGERGGQGIGPSLPIHLPGNVLSGTRVPAYPSEVEHHLVGGKKNFQSFTVICRKLHVASSICLRATIFQNPEGTLWTHCMYIILGH
jgi:hypothetical protein